MRRDEVRDAIDALAAAVPAPDADATAAITRGRHRVRNRRFTLAGVVAVLVVIVASVSVIADRDTPSTDRITNFKEPGRLESGARSSQIAAPTALEAWKCVNPIEYTDDGGQTWRATQLPAPTGNISCTAVAGGTAWAFIGGANGHPAQLLRIRNGGSEVDPVRLPSAEMTGGPPPTFIDDQHGWMQYSEYRSVASTLYRTDDGGASWKRLTTRRLGPVSFASPRIGWSTDGTNVLATRDGGATWRAVHKVPGSVFRVVATTGGAVAWTGVPINGEVAQYRPFFSVSTNGGAQWLRTPGPTGFERPRATNRFSVSDEDHWALMSGNGLATTNDAGRTWQARPDTPLEVNSPVATMAFPTADVGWITSESGNVLRTIDGGNTWTDVTDGAAPRTTTTTPRKERLLPVPIPLAFVSPTEGWLCSAPTLEYTVDAGATWRNVRVPSREPTSARAQLPVCAAIPGGEAWVLTTSEPDRLLQIVHVTGGGRKVETFSFPQVPIEYRVRRLVFADSQRGWAITDSNRQPNVLATVDGGRTWDFVYTDGGVPSVFTTRMDGWGNASSSRAELAHTVDGGRTWKNVTVPTPTPATDVGVVLLPPVVIGDTILVAGSNPNGHLTELFFDLSTDRGQTWRMQSQTLPATFGTTDPTAFGAIDADHWQLAQANRLWTSSDSGSTWNKVAEVAGVSQITDVHFLTPEIGFVSATGAGVAANGTVVLQTNDGGDSWATVAISAPPMGSGGPINFPGGIFGCPTHPLAAPPPGDPPAGLIDAATQWVERGGGTVATVDAAYRVGDTGGSFSDLFAFQIPSCGPSAAAYSWVVEMHGPAGQGGGGSTDQTQVVLAYSPDGWHVYGRYH